MLGNEKQHYQCDKFCRVEDAKSMSGKRRKDKVRTKGLRGNLG